MPSPAGPVSPGSRLDALLAALAELDPADRAPALRSYLEYALEVAQANETEYYTFLSECALLAVDSMQDVRLENVELTIEAMKNPPSKQWGEVITDVAFTFAMQAAILVFWEGAATGVILLASHHRIAAAQRTAAAELMAARSAESALQKSLASLQFADETIVAQIRVMARGGYTLVPTSSGTLIKPGWQGDFEPFTVDRVNGLVKMYEEVFDQQTLAHMATARTAERVARAVDTYTDVLVNGAARKSALQHDWGEAWRVTIGNEKGGVIVAVSQALTDGALVAARAESEASSGQPFLASEVAGRYLDWASEERLGVVQAYASQRMALRATSDADLVAGDAFLHHLAVLATEVVQHQQDIRQRYRAARPAITRGLEAVFWREYLGANGILHEGEVAPVALLGFAERGAIMAGHLIWERLQDDPASHNSTPAAPGEIRYLAQRYPGAALIPDLLAGNLFRRFAAPYYADPAHAKLLSPFLYEAANYDNVAIPPTDDFWGYPDPAGLRLIDELRFLVIRFFRDAARDAPENVMAAALAGASPAASEPTAQTAAASSASPQDIWLDAQATGKDATDRDPAAGTAASRGAEAWFSALAAITPPPAGSPLAFELAEIRLGLALTDLNQDILAYVLLDRDAFTAEDTASKRSKEEVLLQIGLEKQALKADWIDLRNSGRGRAGPDRRHIRCGRRGPVELGARRGLGMVRPASPDRSVGSGGAGLIRRRRRCVLGLSGCGGVLAVEGDDDLVLGCHFRVALAEDIPYRRDTTNMSEMTNSGFESAG